MQGSLRVTDTTYTNSLNITSLTASQGILTDANKNLISHAVSPSSAWTDGTTAGPVLKITVLGSTQSTGATIPSASISVSGVITTGTQRLRGEKQLEYPTITANNSRYLGFRYKNNALTLVGDHWYDIGDTTNITKGQYYWRQYSPNSTANTTTTGFHETYALPNVTSGLTANQSYSILTTKNTVTMAQGGTGNSSYTANRLLYTTASKFMTSDAAQFDGTDLTLTGTLTISNTTAATSTSTGALRISGGLSTGAASYLTGSVHIVGAAGDSPLLVRGIAGCGTDGNRDTSSVSGKSLYLNVNGGPVYVGKTDATETNQLIVAYTTASTSTSTGALIVAGGVGIAEKLYVGSNVNIAGTLTLNGTSIFALIYPIGAIYISVSSTNPGTLFPGTTWVAFGTGRTLISVTSSDTDFNAAEKTGGAKTKTLALTNMPAHSHSIAAKNSAGTAAGNTITARFNGSYDGTSSVNAISYSGYQGASNSGGSVVTLSGSSHTHTVNLGALGTDSKGSGTAFNVMNPYITVYMWKRTA